MAKKKIENDRAPRGVKPEVVDTTPKKKVVAGHTHVAEFEEFEIIEARTKSAGVIDGLKPLTAYHLIECVDGCEMQPIAAAEFGDKIRKGVLVTKLFTKQVDGE